MLTVPLYLFQLSDRVLTSRSIDTLLMLSLLAVGFIGVMSLLDICRRQVLGGLANRLETILGGHLLASVITTPQAHPGGPTEAVRSLHQVRNFISSPICDRGTAGAAAKGDTRIVPASVVHRACEARR
jgi:ATP-binding cassette subfamily C protein